MKWNRIRSVLYVVLCGGMVFQLGGCGGLAGSLVTDLVYSFVLNSLLSGLAT